MRAELFKRRISIQEFFEEIAERLVKDDHAIDQIVKELLARKTRELINDIERKERKSSKRVPPPLVGNYEANALYDVIASEGE